MALVVIDTGVTNVTLPSLMVSLHTTPSKAILTVTIYQIAVVMALLPFAALGERFGLRRVFSVGTVVFGAAALLASLASSLPWLLVARFAQGLGGAAILSLGVALLRLTVSDESLGAAISWNALTVALAAAAGPALGALILSHARWQWIYVAELPLALVTLLAARSLPKIARHSDRLDPISIGLTAAALATLVGGANFLVVQPPEAVALLMVSALAFNLLIRRENKRDRPLVPLDLLRSASYRTAIGASIACFTGQTAGLIALPFYLQHNLDLSPGLTGLYLTVWPLSVAATALVAGWLARRVRTSILCATGATLLASGLLATAVWPLGGEPPLLVPFMMVSGIGFGIFQVANNRNMFLSAPRIRSAAAGGMQGTARLIGQTMGATLIAQLFALVPPIAAPQIAMTLGSCFVLLAATLSLFRVGAR
jgi:DHA2 family multidrug resistance protein-like MFS transporter